MAVHSAAATQQGSSLGLQQRQAAHLLHSVKGLSAGLYCSACLLLPQQAHRLPHQCLNQCFAANHVNVAKLCVNLQCQENLRMSAVFK